MLLKEIIFATPSTQFLLWLMTVSIETNSLKLATLVMFFWEDEKFSLSPCFGWKINDKFLAVQLFAFSFVRWFHIYMRLICIFHLRSIVNRGFRGSIFSSKHNLIRVRRVNLFWRKYLNILLQKVFTKFSKIFCMSSQKANLLWGWGSSATCNTLFIRTGPQTVSFTFFFAKKSLFGHTLLVMNLNFAIWNLFDSRFILNSSIETWKLQSPWIWFNDYFFNF